MESRRSNRHRLSSHLTLRTLHSVKVKCVSPFIAVFVIVWFFGSKTTAGANLLTASKLKNLIQEVRGDDLRLMRWSATKYTKQRQSSLCDENLPLALRTISSSSSASIKALACEFATFCITDNPVQRSRLGEEDYGAIVKLVQSRDRHASAMASHLIYIATFANPLNHQGFFKAGAISQLAKVIKNKKSSKLAMMWAAAALQNLAASYCKKFKGRCMWNWVGGELVVKPRDNSVLSDGSIIRKEIMADSDLINTLKKLSCQGPVRGKMTDKNPYVGKNAIIGGAYDESPNIVAWAATGVLKNLALEPAARTLIEDGDTPKCLCRLAHSPDWLEENKGQGALNYLRPSDPCWFRDDDYLNGELCVDSPFLDGGGRTCADYGSASEEEDCETINRQGVLAREACCVCQRKPSKPNIYDESKN
eukprot:CAMPEP_0178921992 /NCGR_PEP_ID=MMETSP0786-20121207/15885_1 /TAXON_ID=186022 /ORGANISM="Thalassionema frauenfeldii, Strain CCMP 1798" /LENGTH=419 /DNA_ID=CAMNT_0020596265 /DNA_START=121 /DNA_END=1380 /DNA_ORIENTATION=-